MASTLLTRWSNSSTNFALLILLTIGTLAGCGAPMPPMHPTVRTARFEQQQGERMARQGTPEALCESASAFERSATLYQQARWNKRAQRASEAAQEVRPHCPTGQNVQATPTQGQIAQVRVASHETPSTTPEPRSSQQERNLAPPDTQPEPQQAQQTASPTPSPVAQRPQPEAPEAEAPSGPAQSAPNATPGPEFFQHLEQARARAREGEYTEVLRHLLAAWHLQQEPTVMFDIAVCYEHLQQFQQALNLYERLLSHPQLGTLARERIEILRQMTSADDG